MNKKRIMQVVALVVVLSMMFTTAAFATQGNKQFKRDEENYKNAVNYLIQKEIMKGYGKGDYGLDGNVKRGDVIVMIVRAFELEDDVDAEELAENFLDVSDKDEYFYRPIAIAKKFKIAMGDGKYFKPNKPVTVQEAIWLIGRAEELVGKDLAIKGDDLEGQFGEYELDKFAKRKDIALMLHYALTGEVDEENKDDSEDNNEISVIKYTLEDDEDEIDFNAQDFIDAYSEVKAETDNNLKFIQFTKGNEVLYYDYYNEEDGRDIIVNKTNRYFVTGEKGREISKITYVREDDFSKTVEIEYLAYYKDDVTPYTGLIKITVEGDKALDDVKYTIKENTQLKFSEEDFKESIDEIEFILPASGKLYFNSDNDENLKQDELVVKEEIYDDEDLNRFIYMPKLDYTDKALTIKYTAYDGDKSYTGKIVITIMNVKEIDDKKLTMDEDDSTVIEFSDVIKSLEGDAFYKKLDDVRFEEPSNGTLSINYNKTNNEVDKDEFYEIDDISEMTFEYSGSKDVTIYYTAYDYDANIAYEGTINLEQ